MSAVNCHFSTLLEIESSSADGRKIAAALCGCGVNLLMKVCFSSRAAQVAPCFGFFECFENSAMKVNFLALFFAFAFTAKRRSLSGLSGQDSLFAVVVVDDDRSH